RRGGGRPGGTGGAAREPFLESTVDSVAALLRRAARLRDLATVAPGWSLRQLGVRYLRDPRLRMILDRYATYTGSDPRRAPAALGVIPPIERADGGWDGARGPAPPGPAPPHPAARRGGRGRARPTGGPLR